MLECAVVSDCIHAVWAREQTSATIEAGYELILAYLGRQPCHRLLDNPAAIHGYWADMATWLGLDRYPRARRAGPEHHAVVYSTDYPGQRSTEKAPHGVLRGSVAGFEALVSAREARPNQWFGRPIPHS